MAHVSWTARAEEDEGSTRTHSYCLHMSDTLFFPFKWFCLLCFIVVFHAPHSQLGTMCSVAATIDYVRHRLICRIFYWLINQSAL